MKNETEINIYYVECISWLQCGFVMKKVMSHVLLSDVNLLSSTNYAKSSWLSSNIKIALNSYCFIHSPCHMSCFTIVLASYFGWFSPFSLRNIVWNAWSVLIGFGGGPIYISSHLKNVDNSPRESERVLIRVVIVVTQPLDFSSRAWIQFCVA